MLGRRDLFRASAFFTAASYGRISGANDRIRIAGLGVGGPRHVPAWPARQV